MPPTVTATLQSTGGAVAGCGGHFIHHTLWRRRVWRAQLWLATKHARNQESVIVFFVFVSLSARHESSACFTFKKEFPVFVGTEPIDEHQQDRIANSPFA